jgi:molybdopterin-guanine dinucleotide biosynthesis protein A
MPFLEERIIRHMLSLVGEHDIVIPTISGCLEPLHAIYSRRCIPVIESLMRKADLKITSFFTEVDLLEVPEADLARIDPSLRFALNVNTPEDLEKASVLVG